jgi:hypothetical protein
MEKILEITVGDGRVRSGYLPLDTIGLVEALLAALVEEGADPELLRTSNPHLAIMGANSTRTALWADHPRQFRKPLTSFRRNAKSCRLGPKGREFVDRATAASSAWGYVDLNDVKSRARGKAKILRFDAAYRERFAKRTKVETLTGVDEIYARVIRAGGERPTAKLELLNGESNTFPVENRELAKRLGKHLYELVKLKANVTWNRESLEVTSLTVTEILEAWRDVHLADLIESSGGVLPVTTDFETVEQLVAERHSAD